MGSTLNELIAVALREHLANGFRLISVKGELVDWQMDLARTSDWIVSDDERKYGARHFSS